MCGTKHGRNVLGYFTQDLELGLRYFLGPDNWRVISYKLLFQSHICMTINQLHLQRPSIDPFKELCDFLWEPKGVCDEKWVLNEQVELLSKAETVKTAAKINNQLINKINKRRRISLTLDVFLHCCAQSPCRSSSSTSSFLWKEQTAVTGPQIELSVPWSLKFTSFRCEVISTKKAALSICFTFSKKRENCDAFWLLRSD